MERQTADAQKRPKEPIGPLVRFRRCKHLRLGSAVPRSVVAAADASTCDVAFGPSWPLRAKPTIRAARSFWLWAYPRTSRLGRPFRARCPRSVHGPGDERVPATASGQRSSGQRTSPGRTRIPAGSSSAGRWAWKCPEEPSIFHRVPQSKLQRSQGFSPSAPSGKTHYDGRAASVATGLSTTFAVPSRDSRRLSTGHPPSDARIAAGSRHRSVTAATGGGGGDAEGPRRPRTHRNARRNQSVRWSVSADASTCDSVPPYPGPSAAAADASTCDVAFGPSWPLRAKPTIRAAGSFWLWAYPRTSRLGRPFRARCPRSVHGPGDERVPATASGQRSSGQRTSPGRTRIPAGSSSKTRSRPSCGSTSRQASGVVRRDDDVAG